MNKIELKQSNQAENARLNRSAETNSKNQTERAQPSTGHTENEPDKVSVSERATNIDRLTSRANELPDVRQDKVEAMRERIQSGSYNPSAKKIAHAILKEEDKS